MGEGRDTSIVQHRMDGVMNEYIIKRLWTLIVSFLIGFRVAHDRQIRPDPLIGGFYNSIKKRALHAVVKQPPVHVAEKKKKREEVTAS